MHHRRGVTLTEVLVSLFVMGLGLMAILTLFPLGALSMAQAIKDGRTAQAAANAQALMNFMDWRRDVNVNQIFDTYARLPQADVPSIPVYVDPMGVTDFGNSPLGRVIPRTNLRSPNNIQRDLTRVEATYWFTLLDEAEFGENGKPYMPSSQVRRENRYTFAYLCRRPQAVNAAVVDATVVVYHGRPPGAGGQPRGEDVYQAVGAAQSNLVTIFGNRVPVRRGMWILDITSETAGSDNEKRYGQVHGYFYRVTDVNYSSGGQLEVQVQPSLRAPLNNVVVMENVVEVFEKGAGWKN